MKIDRLIGIITILLRREKTTLSALADRFEVSSRTIRRDLDAISQAGIPILCMPGYQGGVSLMEGYRMDHTVLTSEELQAVLAGVKGMESIRSGADYRGLMEKFGYGLEKEARAALLPDIDLTSSRKWMLAPRIELIQKAVRDHMLLTFFYYSPKGEEVRTAEPYQLVYHWSSWYLWAYCRGRQAYRLFKLGRMDELKLEQQVFEPRTGAEYTGEAEPVYAGSVEAVTLAEPSVKWRLVDEMGPDSFEEQEDGKLLYHGYFTDRETLFCWILSFGKKMKLLGPDWLCREFQLLLREMTGLYGS